MSFIITVYTNEGIVMASDSRTTYSSTAKLPDGSVQNNIGIQVTDTTYKTFICNSRIGVSTCGDASIGGTPLAGYIEHCIADSVTENSSVEDVAKAFLSYFTKFTPVPNIIFIIAGYNKIDASQHIYRVITAMNGIESVPNTSSPGATWNGEAEILMRLVNDVGLKQNDGTYKALSTYPIAFNYFTMQDAINFAEYAIDVTIKTMAFQSCIKTVGGPIDILAIKPSGAFWIQHKELHA